MAGLKKRSLRGVTLGWLALVTGCGGLGPSCGGCGASPGYTYPSKVMQGSETVDDAVRARLTERGLDFIAANIKEVIRSQFPPAPGNPNQSRVALPSQVFLDTGGSTISGAICLKGNSSPQPSGCLPSSGSYDPNKVSAVTIDLARLEDKIVMDFIQTPEPGIRLTINDLYLGLDGRIWTEVEFLGLSQFATDADCDIHGATTLPGAPATALGSVSITAEIYPRVSTNPSECQNGVPQCFLASVVVTDASINGVAVGVSSPQKCSPANSNTPAGCSRACSDLFAGGLLCTGVTSCNSNLLCPDPFADCECTDLFCPVYNFAGTVLSQFADLLFTVLEPFLDNILTSALQNALAGFNGQPLEFSGAVNVGDVAGGLIPGLSGANAVGFTMAPTNNAFNVTCPLGGTAPCTERRGMDIYLKAGVEAVHDPQSGKPSPNGCVPIIEGTRFIEQYGQVAFEAADGLPLTGEYTDASGASHVYDIAGSISRAMLNQTGFAVHNAGVLCLSLDTYAVHNLTNGAFSLTAGALDLLTGGRLSQYVDPRAPVLLTLAPEEPATFTMGDGTDTDPHLQLNLKRMHMGIYVLMYERWAHLFEVVTDVSAGLNLTPDMTTHEITLTVATGPSIDNFQQLYNELMPDVDFGDLIPSLVNVALGALLNQDLSFNFDIGPVISDALGGAPIYVVFDAMQTERINNVGEYINLYLSFSATNPNPASAVVGADLQAADQVGTWRVGPDGMPQATGLAVLEGVGGLPIDADLRFAVQVDFGPWLDWQAPQQDGTLWVKDARLMLVGQHLLRVKAMRAGDFGSVTWQPQEVRVWTDADAPQLWLNRLGDLVVVRAEDRAATDETLQMRHRTDDGAFVPWGAVANLQIAAFEDADTLEVQVRDPAGNVAQRTLALRLPPVATGATPASPLATDGQAQNSAGCTCAMPRSHSVPLVAFALALLGLLRRMRR